MLSAWLYRSVKVSLLEIRLAVVLVLDIGIGIVTLRGPMYAGRMPMNKMKGKVVIGVVPTLPDLSNAMSPVRSGERVGPRHVTACQHPTRFCYLPMSDSKGVELLGGEFGMRWLVKPLPQTMGETGVSN